MSATDSANQAAPDATVLVYMDVELFDRRLAELGAHTDAERARLLDTDRTTIWRWRNRRLRPSLDQAIRLAQFLELSVEKLFPQQRAA